jgi:hypothetical protein
MPLPPAVGTCVISGQFEVLPDAVANVGSVTFTLPTELYDTADHVILSQAIYTARLAGDGSFSIALPYADNPGVTPTGWSYLVTENIVGGRAPYYIQVMRSLGAAAKLDELAQSPVPAGPVFPQPWIPLAAVQHKGDVLAGSGVAVVTPVPVGADGTVFTADSTQPGGVGWTFTAGGVASVNGQSGNVVLGAANVSALAIAQNLADLASPGTARTNLGLANSATRSVGTAAGTVAAGDDSRIVNAITSRDQHASKLGLLLEPFPVEAVSLISPGLGLVSGNLYGQLSRPTARVPLTHIGMWLCSAGSGPTGSSYVALLNEAGDQLGVSVDMTSYLTNVANEGKWVEVALTAPTAALDLDTGYYSCVLSNLSSIPKIAGCLPSSGTFRIPTIRGHLTSWYLPGQSSVPSHVDLASVTPAVASYYIAGLPASS